MEQDNEDVEYNKCLIDEALFELLKKRLITIKWSEEEKEYVCVLTEKGREMYEQVEKKYEES